MKSIIQGQNVEKVYSVEAKRDDKGKFISKPVIKVDKKITYSDICEVDGEIGYNSNYNFFQQKQINLSEDETIAVLKEIYRADLNAMVVQTDKVLDEYETNLYESETELRELITEYNEQIINDDEKLKAYCEVHKLVPSETDVDELKKIVYEDIGKEKTEEDFENFIKYVKLFSNKSFYTFKQ